MKNCSWYQVKCYICIEKQREQQENKQQQKKERDKTMENSTMRQELENKLNQYLGGGIASHGYYSSPRFEVEATANGFKAYIGNRGIAILRAAEKAAKELGYQLEYNEEESGSFSTTYNFTK